MSIEIIQRSYVENFEEFSLDFRNNPGGSSGYAFPCDEEGNPDWDSLQPAALENLDRCLRGEDGIVFEGILHEQWSYRHPRVGRCHCGEEITLDRFTNTCCGCGTDYNSAGQELAPRSQWGEETGEHWSDCI